MAGYSSLTPWYLPCTAFTRYRTRENGLCPQQQEASHPPGFAVGCHVWRHPTRGWCGHGFPGGMWGSSLPRVCLCPTIQGPPTGMACSFIRKVLSEKYKEKHHPLSCQSNSVTGSSILMYFHLVAFFVIFSVVIINIVPIISQDAFSTLCKDFSMSVESF